MKRALALLLVVGCADATAQPSPPPIRLLNQGTSVGWVDSLNCGTNTTCTRAGRTGTIAATGVGGSSPGGVSGNLQTNNGAGGFGAYGGSGACAAHNWFTALDASGAKTCTQPAYSDLTGTPTIPADVSGASFITKVAEASLSNEFALGSLANGLLLNTTTTGVPTIYGGTTCTNQFPRSLSASGAATCNSVSLTADVTGTLPINNGGTNGTATPASGAISYGTGTAYAFNSAGTAGQVLASGGTGAPTWVAGPHTLRVSGSNFTTTATTASTITGLSWSASTSTVYYFNCTLALSGTATGGPRVLTNFTGTTSELVASITYHTTAATTQLYQAQTTVAGTLTAACTASCLTTNIPFIIQGVFTTSSTGTFAIQAANSTSGQTTTAFVGSTCIWWQIP